MTKTKHLPDVVVEAAYTVLAARAVAEVERKRMDELDARLLGEQPVFTDAKWAELEPEERRFRTPERILKGSLMYLASDEDASSYYARRDQAVKQAGYRELKPGYCPALMAESRLSDAEHLLIEASRVMPQFAEVSANRLLCAGLDKYKEYIELVCKLAVIQTGGKTPVLAAR